MRKAQYAILYILAAALAVGCGEHESGREAQHVDSLFAAELARAKAYSSEREGNLDSARIILEQLVQQEELSPEQQADVLGQLVYVSRLRQNDENALNYGTHYIEVCRQLGEETKALEAQAELGGALIRMGRTDEGFAKMGDAIKQLDRVRRFTEMDACIRAMKSKIHVLDDLKRFGEIIPLGEQIIAKLDDFGQNPDDYADGSERLPTDERRPGYIDFYTGQAYAFMTQAYAKLSGQFAVGREQNVTQVGGSELSTANYQLSTQSAAQQARRCLGLFEQTAYSRTFGGRKIISSTWCQMGMYDKMLTFYDELDSVWGADTLHRDYAISLYNRAIAARAHGKYQLMGSYFQRYIELQRSLNDAERMASAQEYAARYHEQEQQLALEQERDTGRRMSIIALFLGLIVLIVVAFVILLLRQLRDIRKKNAVLSNEIAERIEYEEKYQRLVDSGQCVVDSTREQMLPTANYPLPTQELESLSDSELFDQLRHIILEEKLFLDPQFGRQQLIDRLHLSKESIGSAFSKGSQYASLASFVNEMRLIHGAKLLSEHPEMSISDVATASGFASNITFSHNFKERYALTPTEFRNKD